MNDSQNTYQRAIQWTFLIALVASFLKTVRIPSAYARAHYLFTYEHGLIKRGLIGTILKFLWAGATPQTKNNIIFYISLVVIIAFLIGIWLCCNFLLKRNPKNYALHLCLVAFTICPALFYTIHLIGFFDNIHYVLTLFCIYVILNNTRYNSIIVAVVSVIAMFIHEIYLFIALPSIMFAMLFKALNTSTNYKRLLAELLVVIVPSVAALVILTVIHNALDENSKNIFIQDFLKNRVVGLYENDSIFYSHFVSFDEHRKVMGNIWKNRGLHWRGIFVFLPTTFLLGFFCINKIAKLNIIKTNKAILILLCLIVILTPELLQIIAWDYERIIAFTSFVGFFCLVIVSSPKDSNSSSSALAIIASLGIIILNVSTDFPMFQGYRVRQYPEIVFTFKNELINLKLANDYKEPKSTLFPNSDFEYGNLKNWSASGEAMKFQPTYGDNAVARNQYEVPEGDWWIGTLENNPKKGIISGSIAGDSVKGKLVSCDFIIKHNKIAFLIGGGSDKENTYVAFLVEGKEIARFAGQNDELMKQQTIDVSAYKNKKAKIEIVDNSSEECGHINADDFGYADNSN